MSQGECSCMGSSLDRFVRPCVLAVLAEHPDGLHGYVVLQRLQEIPMFADTPPDATGLYRALRTMESEGLLEAHWDVEGAGPARRMYTLTDAGRHCLGLWSCTLTNYMFNLRSTLKFIEQALATDPAITSG